MKTFLQNSKAIPDFQKSIPWTGVSNDILISKRDKVDIYRIRYE